jgi:cyanophycin synthetase
VGDPAEYRSPTILDSRRLFGPNRFSVRPGAVLDVQCASDDARRAVAAWGDEARRLTSALGWSDVVCDARVSTQSASLFVSAPVDGLMTATDLSEHAWVAAEAVVSGQLAPDATSVLRDQFTRERQGLPHVVAIEQYAHERGLSFSMDDESSSVGSGTGARVVAHSDASLEDASEFDDSWDSALDIPIALVTGSNGKTTTTRLVAAMWRAAGVRTGWCCSDGVWVDDEQLESGDYTGPSGARRVLCHAAVEAAVLETARGGMLRRGLATNQVDGAVITNVSPDHFGEYGVETLRDLAQAKRIVTRALRPGAPVVLNADDPTLVELAGELDVPVAWFSVQDAALAASAVNHRAAVVRDGELFLRLDGAWESLGAVRDMPITLGGRAAHNVANAAAAALLAGVVGVPLPAIRAALATFGAAPADNPGRWMMRTVGALTVVMDYAHNPDGMASLCRTASTLPAVRRALLLGQAGDRDNDQLRALASAAWQTQSFDAVFVKEMPSMLRGRAEGELPGILRDALVAAGAPAAAITLVPSELAGVRAALAWARAGDVLVLGVHSDRASVLALMDQLAAIGWEPGTTLP